MSLYSANLFKWLFELIMLLHHRHAKVLTLNYDTLVEAGVASLGILVPPGNGVVTTSEVGRWFGRSPCG
jgi:hypothetical protein